MKSSVHIDNEGKDILIIGEGPTQRLNDITLTAEASYPIDFTQSGKTFVLSLHCNGRNGFLLVNTKKLYQSKAKNSEINYYALYLCHISKHCTINNMKKQSLKKL